MNVSRVQFFAPMNFDPCRDSVAIKSKLAGSRSLFFLSIGLRVIFLLLLRVIPTRVYTQNFIRGRTQAPSFLKLIMRVL